jgi:hypothetical protein
VHDEEHAEAARLRRGRVAHCIANSAFARRRS